MNREFVTNLLWHGLLMTLAGFTSVYTLLHLTGFERPVGFHIGWAVAATVMGAIGTLPFYICYRAATGKWFAEYFWLLWTVWMVIVFFALPGTYVQQKMLEVEDHPLLQNRPERSEQAESEEIEVTPFPPQEPYVTGDSGYRAGNPAGPGAEDIS